MIRFFLAFIVLLSSIFLGIQLSQDPGYFLISINHWIIESTVWVAGIALLLFVILTHFFLQLCHKLSKTPHIISQWHHRHLIQKAQEKTRKGLIEYSEGYWQKAQSHLIQALPNADTPLINYLTAARAAQKMGDSKLRDHYLREAQQSMPEAKVAVELTQAQLQLANHQWEQALATLRHLQDLAPNHPYVLKLLADLYQEVRDWPQLMSLLPELKKHHILSEPIFLQMQQNTYLNALAILGKQNNLNAVNELFDSLPRMLRKDHLMVSQYIKILIKHDEHLKAEGILKNILKKEFHQELIELYGIFACHDDQLRFAESLIKTAPHSAALFLCLGRICAAKHLWGKAKHYFEQSINLNPSPVAYFELGSLHEQLHEAELACERYKKGLALATKNETL